MRVQVYSTYAGTVTTTIATQRPEAAPSSLFTQASIHEDFTARVRSSLREYKHVDKTAAFFPAAQQLQTYFPTFGGQPMYSLLNLTPAGSPRDIDNDFMLEITRIRYAFTLNILRAAWSAPENSADAIERAMEWAHRGLLKNNGVPYIFIPGDEGVQPEAENKSVVDIICELGAATNRVGVDMIIQPLS